MENEMPYEEWSAKFKAAIAALGLPECEEELIELSHMEGTSVEDAVAEYKRGF
jgi:hypothetical protein